MKQTKYHAEPAEQAPSTMIVKIEGLKQITEDTFELMGVQHREINWEAAELGLGAVSDTLRDKIHELVFKHDMMDVLMDRIKF